MTLLTPALAMLTPRAAQANDADYCNEYAKSTIDQVSAGHAKPSCTSGMAGTRWSAAFRVHFNYCMSHAMSDVERLRGARIEFLHSCGVTL